jgi:cytochrome c553
MRDQIRSRLKPGNREKQRQLKDHNQEARTAFHRSTEYIMRKLILLAGLLVLTACSNPTSSNNNANPPASHTINKGGHLHKSGLNDPLTNCVSCHGSDLKGGTEAPSCYSCHGKKW